MMTNQPAGKAFWRNYRVVVNLILLLAVLTHSAWRDIHLEEDYYNIDLRNRVVGSRLQKDGILPYFFHWEDSGRLRYADPYSRGNTGANAITASPFFHELLFPICDWPQRTLSRCWLAVSWLLLLAMTLMAFRIARPGLNQLALINLSVLFTLTEGWKMHIYSGQMYLFVAFLMTAIMYLILRGAARGWIAGSVAMAVLLLCRPIALITALPFVTKLKTCRRYFIAAGILICAYGIFAYTNPFERAVWTDYRKALSAHVAFHQSGNFLFTQPDRADRKLDSLEGVRLEGIHPQVYGNGPLFYTENGNIFIVYEKLFHRKIPLWLLNATLLGILLLFEIIWIRKSIEASPPPWQLPVLAWTFYMMVEIFSPVHRNQYNTVEWLPLVLIMISFLELRRWSPALVLICLGLILNISNAGWLPYRHTIGEFCWLAAGLSVLLPETKTPETWQLRS